MLKPLLHYSQARPPRWHPPIGTKPARRVCGLMATDPTAMPAVTLPQVRLRADALVNAATFADFRAHPSGMEILALNNSRIGRTAGFGVSASEKGG